VIRFGTAICVQRVGQLPREIELRDGARKCRDAPQHAKRTIARAPSKYRLQRSP
jgi:hypothetical protein